MLTAAALFDGHDAAINVIRRVLQDAGCEVIHLGHNRGVLEIARAAIQEDVDGIAISSYQGGHVEYFKYMIDLLRERGGEHIAVFGGGGGVIVPAEIKDLHDYGVTRIYSPEDGQKLGLQGMIGQMLMKSDRDLSPFAPTGEAAIDEITGHSEAAWRRLAQLLTAIENQQADAGLMKRIAALADCGRIAAPTNTPINVQSAGLILHSPNAEAKAGAPAGPKARSRPRPERRGRSRRHSRSAIAARPCVHERVGPDRFRADFAR